MKGLILTAKHHDGFCLWPSKLTDHSVARSPWRGGKGDVVREMSEACRRRGLGFGVYLSPWDRHHAEYGRPAYLDYFRGQLRELLTGYGPLFEVWFDGANGGDGYYGGARETRRIDRRTYYDWETTWRLVRELQPGAALFSDAGPDVRWVGNEKGIAGDPAWATLNRDDFAPGKPTRRASTAATGPARTGSPPSATSRSGPAGSTTRPRTTRVKSPEQLLELYYQSVGRGASFLLNVPPDRRGRIHASDERALRGFGRLVEQTFALDLAAGATASASNVRGGDARFAAANVRDANRESYWATDDGVTTPELVLDLGRAVHVRRRQPARGPAARAAGRGLGARRLAGRPLPRVRRGQLDRQPPAVAGRRGDDEPRAPAHHARAGRAGDRGARALSPAAGGAAAGRSGPREPGNERARRALILAVVRRRGSSGPAPRWRGCPSRGAGSRASAPGSRRTASPTVRPPRRRRRPPTPATRRSSWGGASSATGPRGRSGPGSRDHASRPRAGGRRATRPRAPTTKSAAPAHSSGWRAGARVEAREEERGGEQQVQEPLRLEEPEEAPVGVGSPLAAQPLVAAVLDGVMAHDATVEEGGEPQAPDERHPADQQPPGPIARRVSSRTRAPAGRSSPTRRRPRFRRSGCAARSPTPRP